jgi:EF hand
MGIILESFMKPLALAVLLASLSFSAYADEQAMAEARANSFKVFDADGDGKASAAELVAGAKSVFDAMDADSSGSGSLEEFQAVSLGYQTLAEKDGKTDAYKAARAEIFARFDADGDKQLSEAEVVSGVLEDYFTAAGASVTLENYGSSMFISKMEKSLK